MLNESRILNTLLNRFNPGISPPFCTTGRTTIKGTYDDPQGMVCGFHIPHIHLPSKFGFYEGEQQNWNVFKHTNFWILIFQGYFHSNIEIYGRRINPSHIPFFSSLGVRENTYTIHPFARHFPPFQIQLKQIDHSAAFSLHFCLW